MNQRSKVEEIKKEFQSLSKKELYVEVEDGWNGEGVKFSRPKITDNKIKSVWK